MSDLTAFFKSFPQRKLPAKQVLVYAGDQVTDLFHLQSGLVKQYSISASGQELTLQIYKTGTYFYLPWLRDDRESQYCFETLTAVTLSKAPLTQVNEFLAEHPEHYLEINTRVFRGIDQVLFRLETLAFGNAQTKVAATLLLLMKRFGREVSGGTIIEFPLTHREIALLSALSRETVSVEMSKLKKNGVINRSQGRVIITDPSFLRANVPYQVDR